MTLEWKAEDITRAVNGQCLHDQSWHATGVKIDSRNVTAGDLFVAIQGPNHDGHDHVATAFAAGASGAIVARQPSQVPTHAPLVYVNDTFKALQLLGQAGRARTEARIVAVTGSVGKTGTKEMLRVMLGACGSTVATMGSLNNHWGVPLSLARLPEKAHFGVFEIGMNHAGEMTLLSQQVKPHVVMITTIEPAHMEFFPTLEAVADAKAEIFQGLDDQGTVVLNRDNSQFDRLQSAARARGIKKILSFGRDKKADAILKSIKADNLGSHVEAMIMGTPVHFSLHVAGDHMVMNALGALLAAHATGGDIEACAVALSHYQTPEGRGTMTQIALDGGTFTVIDESYNASPAAMKAAIRVLGNMQPTHQGRRVLVLGDMREMGPTSAAVHADLSQIITEHHIDVVHCCGTDMRHLYEALPIALRGTYAPDSDTLVPSVTTTTRTGDIITVKGSKSMHTEVVVNALKVLGTPSHQMAS